MTTPTSWLFDPPGATHPSQNNMKPIGGYMMGANLNQGQEMQQQQQGNFGVPWQQNMMSYDCGNYGRNGPQMAYNQGSMTAMQGFQGYNNQGQGMVPQGHRNAPTMPYYGMTRGTHDFRAPQTMNGNMMMSANFYDARMAPIHPSEMSIQPARGPRGSSQQQQGVYNTSLSSYHQQSAFYPTGVPGMAPSDGSRSSTVTPSFQMAGMNLNEKHMGRTSHDTSRSPSPLAIPAPPVQLRAPSSAPAKLRQPVPNRLGSMDDFNGPLRDSRRLNVLHEEEAETRDDADPKPTVSEDREDGRESDAMERRREFKSIAKSNETNRMVHIPEDASLLLGLRTSTSGSPTTVQTDEGCDKKDDSSQSQVQFVIPKNYPKRLALPSDETRLNALHCFVRQNLLELFVVETTRTNKSAEHNPGSSIGRVGFRCIHCYQTRQRENQTGYVSGEAPMAVFYPRSISEIYRMVTSWQRCHVRKCRNLPAAERAEWERLRATEKCRGKTAYWVLSATTLGLVDDPCRAGGVRFGVRKNLTAIDETVTPTNSEEISTSASAEDSCAAASAGGMVEI